MIGKHFRIEEFVDEETFSRFGNKSSWFIDQRIVDIADVLRDKFGPATINNWMWNGERKWSGYRSPSSRHYKKYSQHSNGRAVDMIFKDTTAKIVADYILSNESKFIAMGLGGIELGKSWLHIDVRNSNELIKFYG